MSTSPADRRWLIGFAVLLLVQGLFVQATAWREVQAAHQRFDALLVASQRTLATLERTSALLKQCR